MTKEASHENKDRPSISIRLEHRFKSARAADESAEADFRARFWRPFEIEERDVAEVEAEVQKTFGERLKEDLLELVDVHPSTFEASMMEGVEGSALKRVLHRRNIARALIIQTTIQSYSSIELGLAIEPVEKLIEFFDGNFAYFKVFLQQYAPSAFASAVGGGHKRSATLTAHIPSGSELEKRFFEQPKTSAPQHAVETSTFDKARWAWVIANTSLLVPTLLAAGYLYLISGRVEKRQSAIDQAHEQLLKAQSDFILTLTTNSPRKLVAADSAYEQLIQLQSAVIHTLYTNGIRNLTPPQNTEPLKAAAATK